MNLVLRVLRRIFWIICYVFPVKNNKIVFQSYYGREYNDNPKYIAEELKKYKENIDFVWVTNGRDDPAVPEGFRVVRFRGFRYIYEMSTAKIWVDNSRKEYCMKKKNQFYIQTWHGGGAQKKSELDATDNLAPLYIKMAKRDSANIDLMISESRFMTDFYHRSFWYDGPVYECGYPRYDILLKHDEELITKVYEYFGIDHNKELVLYAPTFRADYSFKAYDIDFDRLRANLKKRFNKDYVILVHLHPNVANIEGGINYDGVNVINSTFYPDTQELIAVSSILIGDYSSINYDFCLKRMPVFRYTSDLEEYRNDRDLYFPFDEYPYPYAQNNDELEQLILNFNEEDYLKTLNVFFDRLGSVIQDSASRRIADLIIDYIHSKNKQEFFKHNNSKFIY